MLYNMVRFLVGILCTSNIRLLHESFNSVVNQENYDDYHIFIIINTLDEVFYQDVIREFGYNKHAKLKKIIRTESNGSPGKGHNSVLDIFYKNYIYDYLIKLDGDDFLFPCALERIHNVQTSQNNDIITLIGNCSITNTSVKCDKICELNTDTNTPVLNYNVSLGFNIQEVSNISRIDPEFNTLTSGTPLRLLCMNRKILDKYKKLYNEEMYKCVDIEYCIIFYKELHNPDYKITHLSDAYIYLYNGVNDDSVTKHHDSYIIPYTNDNNIREGLLHKYNLLEYRISDIIPVSYGNIIKDNVNMDMINKFYNEILFTLINLSTKYKYR